MKRFLFLLALFVLSLSATVTYDQWSPWLWEQLGDNKTSATIQAIEALFGIAFYVATAGLGIATYLGWQAKSSSSDSVPALKRESDPEQLRDLAYEPTPLPDTAPTLEENTSPYLGLSAFQRTDARLFFGRRRETREALAWLGAPIPTAAGGGRYRWLQIEGNSGAGKSSLVNAGMLPLVEQGALKARTGFAKWRIVGPMMPGKQPLRRLAEVLQQALFANPEKRGTLDFLKSMEGDERVLTCLINDHKDHRANDTAFLLVVDQFEELFTSFNREERRHFDRQLAFALQDNDCPLYLIDTVRIDYLEGFEQLPRLSELYNDHCARYLLKTISQEGLREAIERPAALAGLDVSEVTNALLRDAGDEVGALPLVENALQYLWERRQGKRLSGALFIEKRGIGGLLELQADALLERLDKAVPSR